MPAITYNDFSGGLDRRLPINVLDASHQWTLREAYVTTGRRIRKRPGLKLLQSDLAGTVGLETVNGRLKVFVNKSETVMLSGSLLDQIELTKPVVTDANVQLLSVAYAEMFQGYPYVVAKYAKTFSAVPPVIRFFAHYHHYVDASASTLVTDANCPQSASVTKAASRIFAINGETVRYCAAGAARDWTTASDAGFLPTGIQQDTNEPCTAVGTFQDALVVFYPEGAQIWNVAVDPTANSIRKRIFGVGTKWPQSQAAWASDLAFLSPYGFRSMTVAQVTDRIDDTDVGVPIDTLVVPNIATADGLAEYTRNETFSCWIPQLGQYWTVMDTGTASKVWAYSYSRSSKINCWSEYTFPVRITGITTLGGKVYVRSASALYELDASTYTDAGTPIAVEVQMAFQDAKSPGVNKQFYAADYVLQGSPSIAFKYDPRDLGKETVPQTITGDTRPGDMVPVEIIAPAMAPVFRHTADEAFELTACSFYYELLGVPG